MMDAENKKIPVVLSTDDIRKQAHNWSLAGDVGLLAHLEQFSEKICSKTQDTHLQFNELIDNYDEVQKKIDNTTNQFLALQNGQFVENRVYDEETPSEENPKEKIIDDDERERLLLTQYKEAVEIGIKLLDTHFDEVELPPNSDSDDDEEMTSQNISIMWKPKNPYSKKKFPLLIGSAEWWQDDKVGLGDFKEYPNADKVVSDSESDVEINHEFDEATQISSSSSIEYEKSLPSRPNNVPSLPEDLFGFQNNNFNNSTSDLFGATASSLPRETQNILPKLEDQINLNKEIKEHLHDEINRKVEVKPEIEISKNKLPTENNAFTRELAAKLGSFTKNENNTNANDKLFKVAVDEKPAENNSDSEDLFDETEESDLFSAKIKNTVIGSKNLFFEPESDTQLFSGSNKLFSESGSNLFDSNSSKISKINAIKNEELLSEKKDKETKKPAATDETVKNLFEDVDDDDTLFFSKPIGTGLESKSLSSSESDIFKDKKPSVFNGKEEKKKEKTKDLFFEDLEDDLTGSDIFAIKTDKEKSSELSLNKSSEEPDLFSKNVSMNEEIAEDINALFPKSSDDSFATVFESKTSVFPNISDYSTSKNQNLSSANSKSDLFSDYSADFSAEKRTLSDKFITSLDDDDSSLFLEKPKQPDTISISSSRSSLFDDVIPSKSRLASVFEKDKTNKFDDDLFSGVDNSLFGDSLLSKVDDNDLFTKQNNDASKEIGKLSLFGDCDDTEDLFKDTKENENIFAKTLQFPNASDQKLGKSNVLFSDEVEEKENSSESTKENDEIDGEAPKKVNILQESGDRNLIFDFNGFSGKVRDNLEQSNEENSSETKESKNTVEKSPTKTVIGSDIKKAEESKIHLLQENDSLLPKLFPEQPLSTDGAELFTKKKIPQDFANSKPKPPDTLNLQKDFKSLENNSRSKNVGKLNIPQNLKSKLEATVKPISSEVNVTVHVEEAKTFERENEGSNLDKSFEPPSNLLKCPSKDRVKIPTRRRPQSRRARQEAILHSEANFFDAENVKPVKESPPSVSSSNTLNVSQPKGSGSSKNSPDSIFSSPLSHPLSPSTDEEDFFNVPELDTNFEKEDHSIFQSDLFHPRSNTNEEDSLLFEDAPVLSPLGSKQDRNLSSSETKETESEDAGLSFFRSKSKPKETKIFDFDHGSDEDDDSLFKSKDTVMEKSKTEDFASLLGEKENIFKYQEANKKSLFGVEADEGDDLFGSNFENPLDDLPTTTVENTMTEKSQSKNKSSQPFSDPLGLLSNKEE